MRGSFKTLSVYQDALHLVDLSYELIKIFPKQEKYNLSDQLRRAFPSVTLNIAEGNGRMTTRDYIKFLKISAGSLNEMEAIAEIAIGQKMISEPQFHKFTKHIGTTRWKLIRLIKLDKTSADNGATRIIR